MTVAGATRSSMKSLYEERSQFLHTALPAFAVVESVYLFIIGIEIKVFIPLVVGHVINPLPNRFPLMKDHLVLILLQ